MGRICCILLIFAVIAGCGTFSIPLNKPTLVTDQAERSVTIRRGESTRADVRAALGEPLLESSFWRVELYRVEDEKLKLKLHFIGVPLPVPMPSSEKYHGYVLVTYDTAGRVSQLSSGSHSEGWMANDTDKRIFLRADELAIIEGPVLLADSNRLLAYLAERSHATSCTLVVAAEVHEDFFPRQVSIDDGELFDLTLIRRFGDKLPVLYAITVPPGQHRLLITSSFLDGRAEASFECATGQVLYCIVNSRVEGKSFWSHGKLQATAAISAVSPEAWKGRSIVLYSKGRWLVEPEPDR